VAVIAAMLWLNRCMCSLRPAMSEHAEQVATITWFRY